MRYNTSYIVWFKD